MAYINEIKSEKNDENINSQAKASHEDNKQKIEEKSAFMLEFEKGITPEQLKKSLYKKIDELWAK